MGMGILKDLFIEEYERIESEAEESCQMISESDISEKANQAAIDRFASMCDAAKDRAKYGRI